MGRARSAAWLALPPVLFVAAAFALPMAGVLASAAAPDAWAFATSPYVRYILRVSTEQALWSVVATMALAVPLAWLQHSRRLPGGRLQLALHAAPFVMPVFVIVYGLQGALGARGWLHALTGVDLLAWLGPFGTVVLAHAYYNYGFAARLVEAALRRRPRILESAARTLGASPRRAFLRTTLPILAPSILSVALLVFLFAFASFGVALYMGDGRVLTLETEMYRNVQTLFANPARAAALGVLELAVNGLLLTGYLALRRRMASIPAEAASRASPAGWALGTASWAAVALAIAPIAAVLSDGFRLGGHWSLEPWRNLLEAHPAGFEVGAALRLSALYAVGGTMAALALTACLAYGARAMPRLRRPLEAVAGLPIAGSGVLLGVAFLATFGIGGVLGTTFGPWGLEGTVWIVLVAHTILAFPFVARTLLPAFDAQDARLEESARLLGASTRAVIARVHWPQLRSPIIAAAGLAAALSLADFGASRLLMESGTRGLAVWIQDVDAPFNALAHASSVALAGLLCAVTLALYLAIEAAARSGFRVAATAAAQVKA